jgi:hypothetical protein
VLELGVFITHKCRRLHERRQGSQLRRRERAHMVRVAEPSLAQVVLEHGDAREAAELRPRAGDVQEPHDLLALRDVLARLLVMCPRTLSTVSQNLCSHSPLREGSNVRSAFLHCATLCPKATSRSGR